MATDAPAPQAAPDPPIDAWLYINLARRPDRRAQLEAELHAAGIDPARVHRIDAVDCPDNGNLGCSRSHAAALEFARDRGFARFVVLEDDFKWRPVALSAGGGAWAWRSRLSAALAALPDADVLMLAHNTSAAAPVAGVPGVVRVLASQTRSAYCVRAAFLPRLLANFHEAAAMMEARGRLPECFGDQHWKVLQPAAAWYALAPALGFQRRSFSDNEKRVTDYNV